MSRTRSSLFARCFSTYSMMVPCSIHSDTVTNSKSPMTSRAPISFKTFEWDSVLQTMTSLYHRWGRMVETASRLAGVNAHLSCPLGSVRHSASGPSKVNMRGTPEDLHRDGPFPVRSDPDISKSTNDSCPTSRSVDPFRDPRVIWDQFVVLGKSPPCGEEHVPLSAADFALGDALTRPSETVNGEKCRSKLT